MNKKNALVFGLGAIVTGVITFLIVVMVVGMPTLFSNEDEEFVLSDTGEALIDAFDVSEEYTSSEDSGSTEIKASGNYSTIVYNKGDDTVGVMGYYDGGMTLMTLAVDNRLFSNDIRLYFEDITYFHEGSEYYNEAWGINYNEDDYVDIELTLDEFLEKCELLTPEEIDHIARSILSGGPSL